MYITFLTPLCVCINCLPLSASLSLYFLFLLMCNDELVSIQVKAVNAQVRMRVCSLLSTVICFSISLLQFYSINFSRISHSASSCFLPVSCLVFRLFNYLFFSLILFFLFLLLSIPFTPSVFCTKTKVQTPT